MFIFICLLKQFFLNLKLEEFEKKIFYESHTQAPNADVWFSFLAAIPSKAKETSNISATNQIAQEFEMKNLHD